LSPTCNDTRHQLLDGAQGTAVGGARKLKWKSGESATQVLLELSDIERRAVWETTLAEPDTEVAATISTLHALRITENNSTLLTWWVHQNPPPGPILAILLCRSHAC
jgi:hypothetical protein